MEKFVSKINLRDKNRKPINAGTPFNKGDLTEHTFKSLLKSGDVVCFKGDGKLKVVTNANPDDIRVGGPDNKTPDAALNPKKVDRGRAEKSDKTEAKKKGRSKKTDLVEKVWIADPEDLKEMPFEQLLAIYKDTCSKYKIDVESFDDKDTLIEKMSSEFVKKDK